MRCYLLFFLFIGIGFSEAKEVPITILHTTDLHANILPTTDYTGTKDVGGFARCAWMIKKIRSEEKNVLLVDAGDLYQGSAIGYLTQGSVMIQAINNLRYNAWTLGNHEFDWGIEKVAARIAEVRVPILAANLHHQPNPKTPSEITESFKKILPFTISKIDGVTLGIVGLTTPGIPNWSRPRLIPGITLEDSVSALKRTIPEMKAAGCNVLVLVTHQGIREAGDDHANQLYSVARNFPELDVIVGGHTHILHPEQMLQGILYSQANYWGTYLGCIHLVYDTEKKKLISKKSTTIVMDASVPLDSEILSLFKPDLDRTERLLSTKIGETHELLESRTASRGPKRETPIFNLICASIAEEIESQGGKVDAVLHGILNEGAVLQPGPITMRDVFEIIPYENTIGVAQLKRHELLEVLEENATAYYTGRFRGLWGMTMKLKPSAPEGKRIVFLGDENGKSLESDQDLFVAFNSYDLASGGTRWKKLREIVDRPQSKLKEYDFQTRDALANYIRKHSPLKAEFHGWWALDRK